MILFRLNIYTYYIYIVCEYEGARYSWAPYVELLHMAPSFLNRSSVLFEQTSWLNHASQVHA